MYEVPSVGTKCPVVSLKLFLLNLDPKATFLFKDVQRKRLNLKQLRKFGTQMFRKKNNSRGSWPTFVKMQNAAKHTLHKAYVQPQFKE